MIRETITLYEEGEYTYKNGCFQLPYIETYIHEDGEMRPGILVVPGGGYDHLSPNEWENVALRFFELGYQAFALNYTIDSTKTVPLKMQPLMDISRAVYMIRAQAEEFKLFEQKLAVCGFSAGGHLCASLCVHYEDVTEERFAGLSNRPDAAILCYPVITSSGAYAHQSSVRQLIGELASLEEMKYISVEKQVKPDTPPAFLWHTATDQSVPVENSEMYAKALREQKIPYALHVFSEGGHGLNLGEAGPKGPEIHEITSWPELADVFLTRYLLSR